MTGRAVKVSCRLGLAQGYLITLSTCSRNWYSCCQSCQAPATASVEGVAWSTLLLWSMIGGERSMIGGERSRHKREHCRALMSALLLDVAWVLLGTGCRSCRSPILQQPIAIPLPSTPPRLCPAHARSKALFCQGVSLQ